MKKTGYELPGSFWLVMANSSRIHRWGSYWIWHISALRN